VRRDQWRVDDISDDVGSELFSLADCIHVCPLFFLAYHFEIVYSEKTGVNRSACWKDGTGQRREDSHVTCFMTVFQGLVALELR
jgi:hypothetical protein